MGVNPTTIPRATGPAPEGASLGQLTVHPIPDVNAGLRAASNGRLDELEVALAERFPVVECPLVHRFTPGLYIREITMPAGAMITSKIHLTEHPFVVSKGEASVWTEESGWVRVRAPHSGITKPGTRRILYIHEDTVWTTFHPTAETDIAKIEETIILKHDEHIQAALARALSERGVLP